MAKATSKIHSFDDLEQAKNESERAQMQELLAVHHEDVAELLRLTALLREKGLLDAATATLEQGEDILDILVKQANSPGSLGGIKSMIAIIQGVTQLDSRLVSAVFGGLGEASTIIARGDADPVSGLWDIVKVIRDPDVTVGLTAIFTILKAVGRHLGQQDHSSVVQQAAGEASAL